MAQQREATSLAEFIKFQKIGAAVFGVVTSQGENGNGDFLVMSPAGYRPDLATKFDRFGELAVGISTDMASKVRTDDTGKLLLLVFVGTKATAKSPMKLFNVFEISADEARGLLEGKAMNAEWMKAPANASLDTKASAKAPF